jgi:hypothetical protein
MKTKTFDCVEMKRRGAMRVHERLKDMTVEQQIEYWRRRNKEFLRKPEPSRDPKNAP